MSSDKATTENGDLSSDGSDVRSPLQRMWVWAGAHAVDDFFQGLVPAAVPYFVLDRGFSYVEASGLALAATLGSALPQLLFGVIADRRPVVWMAPLGITLAGIGAGTAGLVPQYWMVFFLLALSGVGVALFHPPAGRDARRAAGDSVTAMSYFAAGGNIGFFAAPALATPALESLGIGATALFIPPAVLVGFAVSRHHRRGPASHQGAAQPAGTNRRVLFAVLTCVEVFRSIISFGLNTFVALYWIRDLNGSSALGGVALTVVLAGGVLGTVTGGRIADRVGAVRTVQTGNALLLPALIALLLCHNKYAALPLAAVVGVVANIPFAVLITLGQDYLPTRPGTAAGVTLGLAVSAGGLFMPILGLIAERYGPGGALTTLAIIPVASVAISAALREPDTDNHRCRRVDDGPPRSPR